MAKPRKEPRNLLTSIVLVLPLLLLYQIGVVAIYPMINGADLLTRFLFQNLGLTRSAYLGYTAAVAVLFALAVAVLRRRQRVHLRVFVPVLLESTIFALTMGSLIVLVMTRVFHIDPRLAAPGPGGGGRDKGEEGRRFADMFTTLDRARLLTQVLSSCIHCAYNTVYFSSVSSEPSVRRSWGCVFNTSQVRLHKA